MLAVLHLCGFFCLSALLALRCREELVKLVPAATACLILTLYVLALFRALAWIDFAAGLVIALCLWRFWRSYGRRAAAELARLLFHPRTLALCGMLLLAFLLLNNTQITARDDLGCWAAEAKSVCYYGGFAPRYQNAAVSFGTYFPGTTLFRCWVCRLAGGYRGGLLAVGSAWLVLMLLAPLLSAFSFPLAAAPLIALLGGGFLLFAPGVSDCTAYLALTAELPLTAAFVGLWSALLSREGPASRITLLADFFCLCFFKAAGIAYAFSVLLFFLVQRRRCGAPDGESMLHRLPVRRALAGALLCLLPALLWLGYCAAMARSDYFTVSVSDAEAAGWPVYLKSLLAGLFSVPAHYTHDGILDLPLAAVLVLNALLWIAAWGLGLLRGRELRSLGCYYGVMLCLLLLTVFLMHSFLFREALYTEPENIAASCARYGQPLILGPLLLLIRYAGGAARKRRRALLTCGLLGTVMLCTCFWTVYYRTIDSRQATEQALNLYAVTEEKCAPFLTLVRQEEAGRILFVYGEESDYQDTARTCLQYLASPSSVVMLEIGAEPAKWPQELEHLHAVRESAHARWVYYTDLPQGFLELLDAENPPQTKTLLPASTQ